MSSSPTLTLPPRFSFLQPAIQALSTNIRAHPVLATSALGLIPLLSYTIPSYNGYIALGRNGLPQNFWGWLIQACLRPISRGDVTNPDPFKNPAIFPAFGPHGRSSFLGGEPLPRRRGDSPTVPDYVAPQRQTTQTGDAPLVARMNAHLDKLRHANPDLLVIKPSGLEDKDSPAMCLKGDPAPLPTYLANTTKGEIAHVHPEASTHLVLSLADAEAAARQGWARRHRLSGLYHVLPLSYVLIYAPRDEEEFVLWKRFIAAAIGFTTAESGLGLKLDV